MASRYRVRSRIVKGSNYRTYYVQKLVVNSDGSENWYRVASTTSRLQAYGFLRQSMGERVASAAVAKGC